MKRIPLRPLLVLCVIALAGMVAAEAIPSLYTHHSDYTFAFYPEGLRGKDERGERAYAVRTSAYAFRLNLDRGVIDAVRPMQPGIPAREAMHQGGELFNGDPLCSVAFQMESRGKIWTCSRFTAKTDELRIIESGLYLQHFDLTALEFVDTSGAKLALDRGVLEFFCWPERFGATLRVTPTATLPDAVLKIVITSRTADSEISYLNDHLIWHPMNTGLSAEHGAMIRSNGGGAAWLNPSGERQIARRASDNTIEMTTLPLTIEAGKSDSVSVVCVAAKGDIAVQAYEEFIAMTHPLGDGQLRATGIKPYTGKLAVAYDPVEGRYTVALGENGDIWTNEDIEFEASNPYAEPRALRLSLRKEGHFGVTGLGFVLRGADGEPTGMPMQISKNWHEPPAWANGTTMLHLEPNAEVKGGATVYYAMWDGNYAVSHAQLCLIGWGGHQQWDEMAIGSFGESITYDPEIGLNRSMVDDVRPLMVWGMGKQPQTRWSWTQNVGGSDFFVLHCKGADGKSHKEYVGAQKTFAAATGPVLADVTYVGEMLKGAISTEVRLRSWGSNDFSRGLYDIKMKVERKVENIDRFALFQLGADNYNENPFERISRGDTESPEVEHWASAKGGDTYVRRGIELRGAGAWFVLDRGRKPAYVKPEDQGAWADRGLIVRGWSGRLGGKDLPHPFYAERGMGKDDLASASIEIGGPDGLTTLEPGDHAELQVEMVILPQKGTDYYGPNCEMREFLATHESWELVPREAATPLDRLIRVNPGSLAQSD